MYFTGTYPIYLYMMQTNFNNAEELIAEESFLAWVYKTGATTSTNWESWINATTHNQAIAKEAMTLLQQIQIVEKPVDKVRQAAAEVRLMEAIKAEKKILPSKVVAINSRILYFAAAAAAIIVLSFFGLKYYTAVSPTPRLATTYGEVKQKMLPDGTEVFLNANSNVAYKNDWKEGTPREVWIRGEAFFHVKKTAHKDKFTVHTDAFDIEVTGTSFNVVNRKGNSMIILKEGSVKIHRKDEPDITMQPGDVVEFSNKKIEKKINTTANYLAWTENKLVFDNTPISQVAAIIQQHYGVAINLKGADIATKTITGILPNNNLDVLLEALEATQDFEIVHSKDEILINTKH